MPFYIFDFDGTLCDVSHRRHYLDTNNWDAFFEACDQDPAIEETIRLLVALAAVPGNRVEIWSGRSAQVEEKSCNWLAAKGANPSLLKRMRPIGDYRPDEVLKLGWLKEELALGNRPDVIFDDRMKVVNMWREHGMTCYQVNPGDFDSPLTIKANPIYNHSQLPILTLLIGPAGAGKSTLARRYFDQQAVISADTVRKFLTGSPAEQARNKDVWHAITALIKTRMAVGLPTVLDATNLKRKDRMGIATLTPQGFTCAYLLVTRPKEEIEATGGKRLEVEVGKAGHKEGLISRHSHVLGSNMQFIVKGDDLPYVRVFHDIDAYMAECRLIAARHYDWQTAKAETIAQG